MIQIKQNIKFAVLIYFFMVGYTLPQTLTDVNRWAYQLQNISIDEITNNSTFDLIVMDYSKDGSDTNKFSLHDIARIKNSGKLAIAYISIGEAENYRFYWNDNWDSDKDGFPDAGAPAWLGNENPNWPGNYKVRFWNDEWKQIIYTYIDTIMMQGFNGIYCDIIDAYYYWMEDVGTNTLAARNMIDFVSEIRTRVNSVNSDFYIIPQNGSSIIFEDSVSIDDKEKYFLSINAIGIEDLFFHGDADENNLFGPDTFRIEVLKNYLDNGKKIFSVEYLTDQDLINQYNNAASSQNYIPYASVRNLDALFDGIFTDIKQIGNDLPEKFLLEQNYPNPFSKRSGRNQSTAIKYSIPNIVKTGYTPSLEQNITLKVYDVLGREVATLVNEKQPAGNYQVTFSAYDFSSGVYFYTLQTGNFNQTKKMVLLR